MSEQRVLVDMELSKAILHMQTLPAHEYTVLLDRILATGYDINANNSWLLCSSVLNNLTSISKILLEKGASVCSDTDVYQNGRIIRNSCASFVPLLLKHIMTMPAKRFLVVRKFLREKPEYLSVFKETCIPNECYGLLADFFFSIDIYPPNASDELKAKIDLLKNKSELDNAREKIRILEQTVSQLTVTQEEYKKKVDAFKEILSNKL